MQPDVSIIGVCLGALDSATKGLANEVIVVDNGSRDGSQAIVSAQYPTAPLIQNKGNPGYGRACNIGVLASRGVVSAGVA